MRTNVVKCVSEKVKQEIRDKFENENVTKTSLAKAYEVSVRTVGRILEEVLPVCHPLVDWDFVLTKNELTIFKDGEPRTIRKGYPKFKEFKTKLIENDFSEGVLSDVYHVAVMKTFVERFTEGNMTVDHKKGEILYGTFPIKHSLVTHVMKMLTEGKDAKPMIRFLDKLMDNPKKDIIEELYGFMKHYQIEIHEDGDILAYKGVRLNYKDGWTNTINNKVGCKPIMPRCEVEHNPSKGCGAGLHAGSYVYAKGWRERTMKVKINPMDVVSVPYDCDAQKMRTCGYEVIEEI